MTYTPRSVAIYLVLLCLASLALADDFKTIDGKEYKNATVSRVEPDSIVLMTKSGISKVYFTELPKEIQERFHYDAAKAAAFSSEQAANQQQLRKQQDELQRKRTEERNKYWADRERTAASAASHVIARQVPYLTAVSLDTGSVITGSSDGARSIGNVTYASTSQTTTGILAVKIQLRTLGSPLVEPYEVQCFFVAKDKFNTRYIYDAIKFHSRAQFDEINVFAKDLFGGTTTVDISNNSISGTTSRGDTFYGTSTSVVSTTKPGSQVEGWIVRVLSRDQVVRFEASLSELKTFGELESALLDKVAKSISFKE